MVLTAEQETGIYESIRDPVRFARNVLGHKVHQHQAAILQALTTDRNVAVKACHASGKTFLAAELVLWWITRHQQAIAVTTAPGWSQVRLLLWGEIHKAVQGARIRLPEPNATELRIAPDRYAVGLSTNEAVRFQGFHSPHVLIVVDEAPGLRADIWESIEGIRAGGDVRLLLLGNPTVPGGPFYEAFTRDRARWRTFTLSAFDTDNLRDLTLDTLRVLPPDELDRVEVPYFVSRRWVRDRLEKWGVDHPMFQARVLGEFPAQAEDALISLAWIERARPVVEQTEDALLAAGIDVAGPGESETVLVLRRGRNIVKLQAWQHQDARGEVVAALRAYRGQLYVVNIDSVGIGFYFAQALRDAGLPVREVNVGLAAQDTEQFTNLKAELYWGLRMRFEAGEIGGLDDEELAAQLAVIRYDHNARGQVVIESKDELRARGIASPDRAEALMLAYAAPPVERETIMVYDEHREISRY